jgi:hypothetical protein
VLADLDPCQRERVADDRRIAIQLKSSRGPVARSSGFVYAGWRSWSRRSRTSAFAARIRYIVRSDAR